MTFRRRKPLLPTKINTARKEHHMARSKPSARNALKKLREQRDELDAQEARLRDEAAGEPFGKTDELEQRERERGREREHGVTLSQA